MQPDTRTDTRFPRARPSAYIVYLILCSMTTQANTVNFTVLAVFYVTVVRMDPLQHQLQGTMLLFEVPTGLFADTFSRRLSVIVGTALLGVAAAGPAEGEGVAEEALP